MQFCTMTFQRAIGLSLAVHVALFGSALAVAHYSGPGYPSGPHALSVSLVGAVGAKRADRRTTPPMTPAETRQPPPVAKDTVRWREGHHSSVAAADEGVRDVPGLPAESAVSAPAVGGASFGYTPEEWGRLQAALDRAKIYPRFARERGIEGTALVRFKVGPTGAIARVAVVKSSGAKILDDASVKTIYRAAPVPYVDGWVEVPMVYRLGGAEER